MSKRIIIVILAISVISGSLLFYYLFLKQDDISYALYICSLSSKPEDCKILLSKDTSYCLIEKKLCEEFAYSFEDYSFCEVISHDISKDLCISGIAEITQNHSLCNKINDNTYKIQCFAFILKNPDYCNQLDTDLQELCYYEVGKRSGDSSICSAITDLSHRNVCIALAKKDENLCTNSHIPELCFSWLAVLKNNELICERMEDKDSRELWCYNRVAKNKLNETICDKISDEYRRGICYNDVAIYKGEPKLCEIGSELANVSIDYCYYGSSLRMGGLKVSIFDYENI